MRFIKTVIDSSNRFLSIVTILIGIAIVFMAFVNSPIQLQIALGLIGAGIISIGLVQIKRVQDSKKITQILTVLSEIQQELAKPKEPESGHTVIADVFSAGLKYYTDHVSEQMKEKQ